MHTRAASNIEVRALLHDSKSFGSPQSLDKTQHICVFLSLWVQNQRQIIRLSFNRMLKNILEPVPEIVGRHWGRQCGNAHVILFSYTFILPDYLSSGFLLLLVLPAFTVVLRHKYISNVNCGLKLKIHFVLHCRSGISFDIQNLKEDTVHLGNKTKGVPATIRAL